MTYEEITAAEWLTATIGDAALSEGVDISTLELFQCAALVHAECNKEKNSKILEMFDVAVQAQIHLRELMNKPYK